MRVSLLLSLLIAWAFGAAVPMSSAAASTISITSPVDQGYAHGQLNVVGAYAGTGVLGVKVAICEETPGCAWLQSAGSGVFGTTRVELDARITVNNGGFGNYGTQGDYWLPLFRLPIGSYRIESSVVDSTGEGPPTVEGFSISSAAPANDAPRFSIMFGRSNWRVVDTPSPGACVELPGTPTLEDAAQAMQARGYYGVTGVVTSYARNDSLRGCGAFAENANWSDLARLRDIYGWDMVSQSRSYKNITTLNEAGKVSESGATLPIFRQHGDYDAWGAFFYPNDVQDAASQAVVDRYFAFGRKYLTTSATNDLSTLASTRILYVHSVRGGKCNDPSLPCYSAAIHAGVRYELPAQLASWLSAAPGQYNPVQFYRFVEGSYGQMTDNVAWDCSSSDPRAHWTSRVEMYCFNDFLTMLDSIPPQVAVTNPAEVANLLGVFPPLTGDGDTTPPDASVTVPTPNQAFPNGPITMTGSAADNAGVTVVKVGVQNRDTKLWWNGASWVSVNPWAASVTLAAPGATSTAWTWVFAPPMPGRYAFTVRAQDATGNVDAVRPWINFTVLAAKASGRATPPGRPSLVRFPLAISGGV